jgi:hypothetical protein
VPATNAYRASLVKPINANSRPRKAICIGTAPREGSTNCGKNAKKNSAVFGFSRKAASQQRSRLTVHAILEATARILIREGFDKASTNRIAEVAGVSVGSLYQYFPGKEAIVAALIDRHNGDVMQTVQHELIEAVNLPMRQAVRKLVAVAVGAHRIDPKLHRAFRADSARREA